MGKTQKRKVKNNKPQGACQVCRDKIPLHALGTVTIKPGKGLTEQDVEPITKRFCFRQSCEDTVKRFFEQANQMFGDKISGSMVMAKTPSHW